MLNLATEEAIVLPKKRNGMLPILIVLFLISYALMSVLVVEQGRTIEAQRNLIHDLFTDSAQLNAMKVKELLRQRTAAQPPAKNNSQTPGPSPEVLTQDGAKSGSSVRPRRPALQKPPKAAADTADARRIPLTI